MLESIISWLVVSTAVLKLIAYCLQRDNIAQEINRKRRLSKWVNGTFEKGQKPSDSDKLFLRENLHMLADGGKLVECKVTYSFVREFFPATSSFLHGAYDDMQFMLICVPAIVGIIMVMM